MSQSSLEEQFKEAGIPVKRGLKVVERDGVDNSTITPKSASNIWLIRWARNSYRNYNLVKRAKGVKYLWDSVQGHPSIIVGVGPSLDDAIPTLKGVAGRALIIATDAAFRPLMANGIRPDLVMSYDCKPEQKLLWDDVGDHDVPCLFDTCANPLAINSWKGPILFYNHFHQADELSHIILPNIHPMIGQIPSGGTVGNTALLLSKVIGCSPTMAVGMDFCYQQVSENAWRYRAQDFKRGKDNAWVDGEVRELYDNHERMARSFIRELKGQKYRMDPELTHYHETFVNFVSHFKVETINCSTEGALKDYIGTMELEDALERFAAKKLPSDLPFYKLIREIGPDPRGIQ